MRLLSVCYFPRSDFTNTFGRMSQLFDPLLELYQTLLEIRSSFSDSTNNGNSFNFVKPLKINKPQLSLFLHRHPGGIIVQEGRKVIPKIVV